jgi:hypothetical protein
LKLIYFTADGGFAMFSRIIGKTNGGNTFIAIDENMGESVVTNTIGHPSLKIGDYFIGTFLKGDDHEFYIELKRMATQEEIYIKKNDEYHLFDHLFDDDLLYIVLPRAAAIAN